MHSLFHWTPATLTHDPPACAPNKFQLLWAVKEDSFADLKHMDWVSNFKLPSQYLQFPVGAH